MEAGRLNVIQMQQKEWTMVKSQNNPLTTFMRVHVNKNLLLENTAEDYPKRVWKQNILLTVQDKAHGKSVVTYVMTVKLVKPESWNVKLTIAIVNFRPKEAWTYTKQKLILQKQVVYALFALQVFLLIGF